MKLKLPFQLEGSFEERAQRCAEFQRLSTDEKVRRIFKVMEAGFEYVRNSPDREEYERYFEEQEAEWWRIQQTLFVRHAQVSDNPTDAQ